MAKLKTRTNQPVEDTEGLLNHLSQNGNTTEIDGNLKVNGVFSSSILDLNDLSSFFDLENVVTGQYVRGESGVIIYGGKEKLLNAIYGGTYQKATSLINKLSENYPKLRDGDYLVFINYYSPSNTLSEIPNASSRIDGYPFLQISFIGIVSYDVSIEPNEGLTLAFYKDVNDDLYFTRDEL